MILSIVKLENGHYEIIWVLLLININNIVVVVYNITIQYVILILKKGFDFEYNTELKYVQLYIRLDNWDR